MEAKTKLVILCGATATGKTSLGIRLAKALNGEIASADSMQIYKGISIATAAPTLEERQGIPHHLIEFLEVGTPFSVADYCNMAHKAIADITSRGKLPIMVGGTGLYIDSVKDDVKFSDCGNTEIRERLNSELLKNGAEFMYNKLLKADPKAAEKINMKNTRRIIRALEVYEATGVPFSRHNELSKKEPSRYNTVCLNLCFENRNTLYERIGQRVDSMINMGLVEEAKRFREFSAQNGAGQAIGHKELYPYLDGEISLDEAAENLKRATRRYAKRQITWFSKSQGTVKLIADGNEDIFLKACKIINETEEKL